MSPEPADTRQRLSADVLFRSIAGCCAAETCAVILTGMSDDGVLGMRSIHEGLLSLLPNCVIIVPVYPGATPVEERLQKVLAHAGVASRRKCEELISQGRVAVNGQVVTQLGVKVDPGQDTIEVDGQPIALGEKVYILLHKPRGYLSDTLDLRGRPSALSLVPEGERLYPAGRLDARSEGLLLLTNDGELAHRLTHPRYEHEKEYLALVVGEPTEATLRRMLEGVERDGETLRADAVRRLGRLGPQAQVHGWGEAPRGMAWLRIILHEGKKRHIRRMCAALSYPVRRLIRVRIGPLELGDLSVGEWRYLTDGEVKRLRSG